MPETNPTLIESMFLHFKNRQFYLTFFLLSLRASKVLGHFVNINVDVSPSFALKFPQIYHSKDNYLQSCDNFF